MTYVVPFPEAPSLEVVGEGGRFPVRRIFCVGRNYAAHAREMGKDPDREPPFFFMKPAEAIVPSGAKLPYPPFTQDLHHEIELVAAIGREGAEIAESAALDYVYGYAVGIDLTCRDLQAEAKKMGRPWEVAKGFDRSAPCGAVQPASAIGHPASGPIWLRVGDEPKQSGDLSELIWPVPALISILSRTFRLLPGDLIFTGTPAGVGPLARGDHVTGGVEGVGTVEIEIV
ncbi:MAG: fumarylacetoacetate hydrolase family protein [Rhodospirillales bacterium]|nr:fumarylacetoacetate hydrolase family protein [Rhodospirillales bacterium]MDH3911346.1 fumarylacetoacetate hydrolase family protein [Rhodospirillales bacterium]MDH3919902.1 fumarylacetoacetate hydrolase family protein [Rhodospirillales bacterium]